MRNKSSAASSTQPNKAAVAVKPRKDELGIRQFTGSAMRTVLADVRAAFGPDAIILKQESSNGRIRITACSERQLNKLAPPLETSVPEVTDFRAEDFAAFGAGPVQELEATQPRARSDSKRQNESSSRSRVATVDLPTPESSSGGWWGRRGSKNKQVQLEAASADALLLAELDYSEFVVAHLVGETDGVGLAERIARQLVEPTGPITSDLCV